MKSRVWGLGKNEEEEESVKGKGSIGMWKLCPFLSQAEEARYG